MINIILGILASYFLGAVPTAYIAGKIYKGIDIRQHGSGNVGATNVFRVLGKKPGSVVLSLDILKGVLAITFVGSLFNFQTPGVIILLGFAVVCGHNWTVFLNFKGGKGVATSLGVLIGLAITFSSLRLVLGSCLFIWGVVFIATGYVSLSSMLAAFLLPILMVITNQAFEMVLMGVIFCLFVFMRHRPNIKRLFSGTESRVRFFSSRKKS